MMRWIQSRELSPTWSLGICTLHLLFHPGKHDSWEWFRMWLFGWKEEKDEWEEQKMKYEADGKIHLQWKRSVFMHCFCPPLATLCTTFSLNSPCCNERAVSLSVCECDPGFSYFSLSQPVDWFNFYLSCDSLWFSSASSWLSTSPSLNPHLRLLMKSHAHRFPHQSVWFHCVM